ncbi:uncharacterized protein PHACADRAFT_186519 [Phanerochaete carnosa HHB-10118-sp]|uniref:AAA+ ATPase domain-containing protein n=1 Tax=Phanerochaete carnosa (strain HHB-10118-sp) TaxID=650164 RepID=K5UR85_PHACS|nr:uncharacterized protein PHACADRAFT_186519 [Phanerochaete carnosa HHB-10118-sp]EKM52366.1 hypothetical protein PHACADRAFT_186519 [Phanerochaete carnosa HHB-10118-sp]
MRAAPSHIDLYEGEPFFEEMKTYPEHFLPLIEYEQQSDEAILRERLSTWSLERLQQEGYCITDLSAYWLDPGSTNSGMGRFVASFFLGPGITLPAEHRFERGTQVLATHLDPLREVPQRGSVLSFTETQLRISFQEKFSLGNGQPWRLDVTSSALAYQRMRAAIQRLNYDPAQQFRDSIVVSHRHSPLSPSVSEPSDREIILHGSYLRDLLLRGFRSPISPTPITSFCPQPNMFTPDAHLTSWARRYARPNPVVIPGDPDLKTRGLNDTQIRAVAIMLGGMSGPIPKPPPSSEEDISVSDEGRYGLDHTVMPREGERRMALVLGPPGTGKTKTIIEAVRLLKQHFAIPYPVLLCTYTNVAVDNLVEGLVRQTSHVELPGRAKPAPPQLLRVGSPGKVRPSLERYTLEAQVAVHALAPKLEKLSERATELARKIKDLSTKIGETHAKMGSSNSVSTPMHDVHEQGVSLATVNVVGQGIGSGRTGGRAKGLQGRLEAMEADKLFLERQRAGCDKKHYAVWRDILTDVVSRADIVCTTCISSASSALDVVDFPLVFIDEASMSTEPASLIPLMKGSQHVAFIGDHKQLPPVITSPEAQAGGLGVSLFERLSEENFLPSIMLDIQYRMHPTISCFPSHEFYDRELRDGTVDETGKVVPGLVPPESRIYQELQTSLRASSAGLNTNLRHLGADGRPSVVFLDHVGAESAKDRSRVNWNEVHIVCSLVEDLMLRNPLLPGSQIGIIAPYAAQITLLTRLLTIDKNYAERFESVLGPQRAMDLANVEIKTVDGFEGREKEVIIFSTVRNNSNGHIGFLADRRRLNVGLTRAKRGLFVVGSISTLKIGKGRIYAAQAAGVEGIEAAEDLKVPSEDGKDATAVAASPATAPVKKRKRASKTSKGAEAWHNYMAFLQREQLVVRLNGDRLQRLLRGNVEEVIGLEEMYLRMQELENARLLMGV